MDAKPVTCPKGILLYFDESLGPTFGDASMS